MVPTEKILQEARKQKVDMVGLSGLITPSLQEMVHVAAEMQRQKFNIPLLIGGATTSQTHTAVKIEPAYSAESVIYVPDASRSVSVISDLLNPDKSEKTKDSIKKEYKKIRDNYSRKVSASSLVSIEKARSNAFTSDRENIPITKPSFLGLKTLESYPLSKIIKRIDWTPFFKVWELKGKYPKIFDDNKSGNEAKKLDDDAITILEEIGKNSSLQANAVVGFFPANSVQDDIEIYVDEDRSRVLNTFHMLRQQINKSANQNNMCLADFIAPRDSGKVDYLGLFTVTAGIGVEKLVEQYENIHDDYHAIMVKALADRLAEGFAEHLHELVRKDFWGYQADEKLTNEEIIAEKYQGIRPAPGYPACPDHTEKEILFSLLKTPENCGVTLTDSFAMLPAASVSGFYFAHPQSAYFGIGKIAKDQVTDYARRKGISVKEAEKWLHTNLGY
jgi:5-methyltetrahydrofolate--homocysteine methyltransferase